MNRIKQMSKIKLALDVVSDLRSLAESIVTLVQAMETNEPIEEIEAGDKPAKETKKKAKAKPSEEPKADEPTSEVTSVVEKQPTLYGLV